MYKKAFTLVELIVSVGILSIMMLIISQPVASIIKYQRESQLSDNMRDNLQFAINKIEKELKTSSNVVVSQNKIEFKDQENATITYIFNSTNKTITRNGTIFMDTTIFRIINFKTWSNSQTKLVTLLIDAESKDSKDKVSMQVSVYPLNN